MEFMKSKHRGLYCQCALVASLLWCGVVAHAADGSDASPDAYAPIESMQSVFAEATDSDTASRSASWDRIREFDAANRKALIQQLALFGSDAKTTAKSMLAGAVIKEFAMTESDVVGALVPMLAVDDEAVQKTVAGMLAAYEDRSATRPADFSAYRAIIEEAVREQREVPAGLVDHMYDVDPGVGMLTMMRGTGVREPEKLREILWAEHAVAEVIWKQTHGFLDRGEVDADAVEQLQRLSNHPQWWARMYVPATMRRHKSFRSVELLERLEGDPHPQVAALAKAVLAEAQ